MSKKISLLTIALVLILGLAVVGCGKKDGLIEKTTKVATEKVEANKEELAEDFDAAIDEAEEIVAEDKETVKEVLENAVEENAVEEIAEEVLENAVEETAEEVIENALAEVEEVVEEAIEEVTEALETDEE